MDKAIAICLTALLLLAGCLSSEDDDVISIVGCDDESALNYDENVTESGLCASEEELEAGIVSFINLLDEGPDMDNITSTIGYSMEVSSVMGDETWHYMETMVVTPDGMKVTIEDNYGEETMISDMIVSGSEVQYSFNNGTSDYQVRMSHEGTTLEAFDAMMNMGLDMDMDMEDDMDDDMVCHDMSTHTNDYSIDNQEDCEDAGNIWISDDSDHDDHGDEGRQAVDLDDEEDCEDHGDLHDDDEGHGEPCERGLDNDCDTDTEHRLHEHSHAHGDMTHTHSHNHGINCDTDNGQSIDIDMNKEDPETGDYTGYFNPVTATFSGFEVTDEGMVFSGLLNVVDAPFGALEVHTTSDFTVTGFSMMDVNDENNWVKFVLINSGETVVDNTLPLSAIPFILLDPALFGDDEGEDMDDDMVCYDMENHEVVDIYDEMDCYDAGYMWTSMDRDEHDHDGHDEDREEDMVCYDMDRHVVLEEYDNQMDCEYAGYNWVSLDSGDGHTGENSWSFDRGMEDCDSDSDSMVSYEELVACIDEDLANDGFGDMSASDVHADEMFAAYDEDDDTFLNNSEFDNLNSMYSSDDRDEHHDESYDCMNVTAGDIAPENGTFTFSNGTTVDVEAGYTAPEDGVYCIESHDRDEDNPEEIFAMIDADGDGEVTASEWSDAANDSEDPMTDEDYQNLAMMLEAYDDDDSGGLNLAEFENMMEAMNDDDDNEDDPEMIFRMIDSNGDGEVTASEWSDATNNSEEPMSDEDYQNLVMMMDMYDDDDSGGLNLAEFENMMGAMNDDDGEDVMEDMQMVMVMTMVDLHGDLDDYSVTLAMCDDDMVCEDDVYSVKLSDIAVTEDTFFFSGHSVMFMDMDESGTLNSGDMIMIDTSSLEVDEDWNTVRLHSEEANAYSDENPMPGFTGILATIGLLGAALIRRE